MYVLGMFGEPKTNVHRMFWEAKNCLRVIGYRKSFSAALVMVTHTVVSNVWNDVVNNVCLVMQKLNINESVWLTTQLTKKKGQKYYKAVKDNKTCSGTEWQTCPCFSLTRMQEIDKASFKVVACCWSSHGCWHWKYANNCINPWFRNVQGERSDYR